MLVWLSRLRWLAVVGQIAAVIVAVGGLGMSLPLWPIASLIALTFLSNLLILLWIKSQSPPALAVPASLVLDVLILTALLYLTGGPTNPFAILYLVHVTIAVVALGAVWTWGVVAAAALSYGFLLWRHLPLSPLPLWAKQMGNWTALVLVSALITYFISQVTRSLRRRERELALLHTRAQRSEQLAALTTLAAGAAHELGTPLGTIAIVAREIHVAAETVLADADAAIEAGATGVAAGHCGAGGCAVAAHIVDDALLIRRQVDRCRAILDRMRVDLGEDAAHGIHPQPLGDLIAEVRHALPDARQARLVIEGELPSDWVIRRSRAIEQALGVLIGNAFDASSASQPVALRVARKGGRVTFQVMDRGVGMPPEVLRRVGEPFFTTKAPGHGMGLGIFLVRLVAERHGGTLHFDSRPHHGTTTTLDLDADEVLVDEAVVSAR